MDEALLAEMIEAGYVRRQTHPTLPLEILNYSEKATYEGVWNDATRQCRGLIRDFDGHVVARPFSKFFNYGEPLAPDLALDAPVVVTDKLDGSLGILYPTPDGYAVATRGSFTSDQALHATDVYRERYEGRWHPRPELTYLFEILYPLNRIVVDYEGLDDLVYLDSLELESGFPSAWTNDWPGPRAEHMGFLTLAEALAAEPRPNREGLAVYFLDIGERLKIKQDDYVALHRILTGTNARHVWEVAAVQACAPLIRDPKHWGSFLGIDPARAEEVQALGDDWLADVPDEFYGWVRSVTETAEERVIAISGRAVLLGERAAKVADRRARYDLVRWDPLVKEIMRLAGAATEEQAREARASILLRAWREACPEPTAPFARSEAVA